MTTSRKLRKLFYFLLDTFLNFALRPKVIYVVDDFNWSIKHDGKSICNSIGAKIKIRTTTSHIAPPGTVIHFGDIYTFFSKEGVKNVSKQSPIILTWFHIVDNDIGFKYYSKYKDRIAYLHLSNHISQNILLKKGFPKDKIFFAPIPVNTSIFKRNRSKQQAKIDLNIPLNKIVIGSFQKDGNGWGEGLEPKLVKGPDIFCDIVEKLAKVHPIHILLSGPARGYVINRLKEKDIPYSHFYFDDPNEVSQLYEALDLYLMTSRIEGGPKSITESWAMGVPYVGTKVGMVHDIGLDGRNFIEIDGSNVEKSFQKISDYIDKEDQEKAIIPTNALQDVQHLSLQEISKKYLQLYIELSQ